MKNVPWIPAPCKATAKRFQRSNITYPRRKPASKPDNNQFSNVENFRDGVEAFSDGEIIDFQRLSNGQQERRFSLLDSLQQIKILYLESESKTEALKIETESYKDELLRTRLELELEKEARRSAEMRMETVSIAIRELEKVVDAQRDHIRELYFIQRLHPMVSSSKSGTGSKMTATDRTNTSQLRKVSGQTRSIGTMTPGLTSNASVQATRAVHNQAIQTNVSNNGHVRFADSDADVVQDLKQQLDAEKRIAQSLRRKLQELENRSENSNGEKSQHQPTADSGSLDRAHLHRILSSLQELEEEVADLRKRLRKEKLVSLTTKHYFRTMQSAYKDLFA